MNPKIFRLCLRTEELKFLKQILEEEQIQLCAELSIIHNKLDSVNKKILFNVEDEKELATGEAIELIVNQMLKNPSDPLHEERRKLKAKEYVIEERLCVVVGFIDHFERLLNGKLPHGGRSSWFTVRGRESLACGDGLWFKRPTFDNPKGEIK